MNTAISELSNTAADVGGFPAAAVIIPHYNDVLRLERCLTALMAGGTDGVEVVVVDNGSSQSLDALRAAFPKVRFLIEPEKGAAVARNHGIRETAAPVLVFIDADCVPAPNWLKVALKWPQMQT